MAGWHSPVLYGSSLRAYNTAQGYRVSRVGVGKAAVVAVVAAAVASKQAGGAAGGLAEVLRAGRLRLVSAG